MLGRHDECDCINVQWYSQVLISTSSNAMLCRQWIPCREGAYRAWHWHYLNLSFNFKHWNSSIWFLLDTKKYPAPLVPLLRCWLYNDFLCLKYLSFYLGKQSMSSPGHNQTNANQKMLQLIFIIGWKLEFTSPCLHNYYCRKRKKKYYLYSI